MRGMQKARDYPPYEIIEKRSAEEWTCITFRERSRAIMY